MHDGGLAGVRRTSTGIVEAQLPRGAGSCSQRTIDACTEPFITPSTMGGGGLNLLDARRGVEPRSRESKALILPLDERAILCFQRNTPGNRTLLLVYNRADGEL